MEYKKIFILITNVRTILRNKVLLVVSAFQAQTAK